MVEGMELFEGLRVLSAKARSRRLALTDMRLVQRGAINSKAKVSVSGKPRTGGLPRTGARPIDPSAEDEVRKRRLDKGGAGGLGRPMFSATRGRAPSASAWKSEIDRRHTSLDGAPARSDLAMKSALASGSQSAVVKLASYASGSARVNALMSYQSHGGELELEREDRTRGVGRGHRRAGDRPMNHPSASLPRM